VDAPPPSSIAGVGEPLYLVLAVWLLALPLVFTVLLAPAPRRLDVWPFLGTAAGALAFALARSALALRLDVVAAALVPLLAGPAVALAVTSAGRHLPGRRSRWCGHRLTGDAAEPCTLTVTRRALAVEAGGVRQVIPAAALTQAVAECSVVRIHWRAPDPRSLTFLPDEEDADSRLVAAALAARILGLPSRPV
jgi:hypothetical protein